MTLEDSMHIQRLRVLRMLLAARQGVPPYVVFSDAVLRDMTVLRPRDGEGFLQVRGVGDQKLRRYGTPFLAVLNGADPSGVLPD